MNLHIKLLSKIYVYKYNLFITETFENTEKHEETETLILSRSH